MSLVVVGKSESYVGNYREIVRLGVVLGWGVFKEYVDNFFFFEFFCVLFEYLVGIILGFGRCFELINKFMFLSK